MVLQKSHCAGCFFRYCTLAACFISSNSGCRQRMCAITAGGHFFASSDNSGIETCDSGKSPKSTTVHRENSGPDHGSPEPALEHYGRPSLAEFDSPSRCRDDHSSRKRPERFVVAQYLSRSPAHPPAHPMVHIVIRQT